MANGARAVADADDHTECSPASIQQAIFSPTIDALVLFTLTVLLALLAVVLF